LENRQKNVGRALENEGSIISAEGMLYLYEEKNGNVGFKGKS